MVVELALFFIVLVMAAVSASVGPAGGVVLASLAVTLPAPAVVPVHAALQAGGSSVRLAMLRPFLSPPRFGAFALGSIFGFAPAALLVSRIDPDPYLLRGGLGLAALVPSFLGARTGRRTDGSGVGGVAVLGAWTSFCALFVGATGAVIGAVLATTSVDAKERVATQTGCLWLQHLAKLAIYSSLGFSFRPYLPLLAVLLPASAIGAAVGRRVLTRSSNVALQAVFEIVNLGLGAYLVATATVGFWMLRS